MGRLHKTQAELVPEGTEHIEAADNQTLLKKRKIKRWPLKKLKVHPQQAFSYHNLSEGRLEELAEDMREHGQTTPIEALPDGTILDGHQRLLAAQRLGWDKVRVWVRVDLDPGAEAERRHLEANLARRHLDPLDEVRTFKLLLDAGRSKKSGELTDTEVTSLRDMLQARLNLTDRHVRRLLNIAAIPMPIQLAFQQGQLKLVVAEKVSRLTPSVQKKIAEAILRGEEPSLVVNQYLPAKEKAEVVSTGTELDRLLDFLTTTLDDLGDLELRFDRHTSAKQDLETLERFDAFARKLKPILESQAAATKPKRGSRRSATA
jgi:ParB/RepB/Spo0J family partition protein